MSGKVPIEHEAYIVAVVVLRCEKLTSRILCFGLIGRQLRQRREEQGVLMLKIWHFERSFGQLKRLVGAPNREEKGESVDDEVGALLGQAVVAGVA